MFTVQQPAHQDVMSFFGQPLLHETNPPGTNHSIPATSRPKHGTPSTSQQNGSHNNTKTSRSGGGGTAGNLSHAEKEELLSRTIHLRFLPTGMRQGELAALCNDCGPVNRVRICGGQNNPNQNWIYGFVEFSSQAAAHKMMKKSGMELHNGAGKPPLRLKCHCARDPIVDRVFHDADPQRGTPCQFGRDAFAGRTLKEALESYFNLVTKASGAAMLKELQQQQPFSSNSPQQQRGPNFGASTSSLGSTPSYQGTPQTHFASTESLRQMISSFTPGSSELHPLAPSDSSSNNGRTPSNPPSPQLSLLPPASSGVADFTTAAVPPPLTYANAAQASAEAANSTPSSLYSDAKLAQCMSYLDSAMRAGSAFAKTRSATRFFEAMGPLLSLHETLNTIVPPFNTPSNTARTPPQELHQANSRTSKVDDALINMVRGLRIAAYIIATFLHQIRGSLAEMLPCITKALDVIGAVSMTPLEKPTDLHVNSAGDDDDDAAFLSALSLVHVSQPSAVISHHAYETALAHQTFLVNALLAIGFGMESVNSLIARCAFSAARRRAHVVLGLTNPNLDRALAQGGIHDLCSELLPSFLGSSSQEAHPTNRVLGDFAGYFFHAYGYVHGDSVPKPSMDVLPPLHCVAVFSHKTSVMTTSASLTATSAKSTEW